MENTWDNDLKEGHWAERQFAETMIKVFNATDIEYNEAPDAKEKAKWDVAYINSQGDRVIFEVKYDKKSTITGNFAIEYFGRTSPSGIAVTTAEYWVTLSDDKFYIIKTAALKWLINNNNFRQLQIKNGTAWCYLIPIEKINEIPVRIIDN